MTYRDVKAELQARGAPQGRIGQALYEADPDWLKPKKP
jgi:hypothetical protein